ncbi:NtaA/DmoA family FMN-dependent monooxygenase [Pseudonocardia sp. WMMC193]|uniref:NtaA/DmoA family FMN-dependent monooxygenase n=1 Tax=Pseudonocardia sp. WMMC193 TaxID=2911965 RepID=UPI001EEF3AC3|nr:NtaA/DmoA family FMN-dependent monooxygenase [Pseudonocardia sp. WMMC193]MCF7550010.1 NtaA/DmoA family FMN-dependent monooxygenase [Pseudonocardia sp. WMMC193]
MTDRRFHLGWFMNFSGNASWRGPWGGDIGATWPDGRFHVDFARMLERACFDYIMIEDSSMVPDCYAGSLETELKHGLYAPKHDPVALQATLAQHTDRLGIVATMSTSLYPPFLLARGLATLDHLSSGRVGWNIVTSSEDRAAQNYGLDALPDHDERYDRADEFVDLVERLWGSWAPDALVMDRATGRYVDHTKVAPIDFQGKWFRSRGPLNTLPMPQGRPVYCQAGGSTRGREFAAAHAETIIASADGVAGMKAYREDIRARMERLGRDPDSCKILFVVAPVLAETDALARSLAAHLAEDTEWLAEAALAHLSALTENDFSGFDLDGPVPAVTTNGHRSTLADFLRRSADAPTLREAAARWTIESLPLVGSPETVADTMCAAIDEVGGDGFLITGGMSRDLAVRVCDGLVPALQRRGRVRTAYTHEHFRDNLMEF